MFLWIVMAWFVQLWSAAHRGEERFEGPNPYPVVAVVDNRAERTVVETPAWDVELLAA